MRNLLQLLCLLPALGLAVLACSGSEETSTTGGSGGNGGTGGQAATGTAMGGAGSTTSGTAGAGGTGTGGSGGMGPDPNCPPLPTMSLVPLTRTEIADFNTNIVLAIGAPGDPTRLYVLEQNTGEIRIIKDGTILLTPFFDLGGCGSEFSCNGERGLLGLAFHPNYAQNGRFWINYTDSGGDTVVAEYKRSADPDVAEPAEVKQLLTIAQPAGNHNGGGLAFGPDGYLYIGMGDGGGSGDTYGNGQNLNAMLGKMLRVDVDAYPTPPAGNLPSGMGNPHIWAIGLRNPWRYSFDRCNGDLYIGDVGQGEWEEIDVEPAGQGLRNYGWNTMEGAHCFNPMNNCDMTGLTLPVAEYDHGSGQSVTGGYVYRGTNIPSLVGRYLYADYVSRRVWSFVWDGSAATDPIELTNQLDPGGNISSFGQDANGELYIVEHGGRVFRIDPQ
jgi:glucose/arabinose dehydrogenase